MSYRKIGIYGVGKVATSFGNHLEKLGYQVGYYGRSTEHLRSQHKMVFGDWSSIIAWADLLGFVVTDSAISHVSRMAYDSIAGSAHCEALPTVFHMSGALDISALEGRWPYKFSLHPLRAFAGFVPDLDQTIYVLERQEIPDEGLREERIGVCPNNRILDAKGEEIRLFVDSLRGTVLEISSQHKVHYHTSAVIASNFMVSVMHFAKRYLNLAGIEDEKVMWPLVDSALENMKRLGIDEALTGPINRGDLKTVKKHVGGLKTEDIELYAHLSKQALDLSHAEESLKRELRVYLDEVLRQKGMESL